MADLAAPWSDPDLPDCTPEEAVAAVEAVRAAAADTAPYRPVETIKGDCDG